MTADEACALIAQWHRGNPPAWTGFGVEAGVAQRLAPLDYDHAARLEAHLAALPAKEVTPTRVEEAVRATEPDEGMRVVMGIVKTVPLYLLRREMAADPRDNVVAFMPLSPRVWVYLPEAPHEYIGCESTCTYNSIYRRNCDCYRCQYRNSLGNAGAWIAAFEWARTHADDGRPIPQLSTVFCPPKPRRAFRDSEP